MDSVGEYIKRERELRGFTLEEVSRLTKISMRYLRALEEDNFECLPAEPFTKGFLRAYAQCIGLDSHEVMLVYEEARETEESLKSEIGKEESSAGQEKHRVARKLIIGGSVLAACVIAVILIAALVMEKRSNREADKIVKSVDSIKLAVAPSDGAQSKLKGSSVKEGESDSSNSNLHLGEKNSPKKLTILPMRNSPQAGWKKELPGEDFSRAGEYENTRWEQTEKLFLKVRALSGTWVEVRMDELNRDERLFMPRGDTRVWSANDRILLTLGNVKGVELELNGEKITVPKLEGNVLRNYPITRNSLIEARSEQVKTDM